MSIAANGQNFERQGQLKISLKWLLTIAFVFQSIGAIGLAGWLTFRNNKASTARLISEIQRETARHLEHEIDHILASADILNELTTKTIEVEQLNLENIRTLDNFYWSHITSFDTVRGLSVGNAGGDFVGFSRDVKAGEPIYYQEYNDPQQGEKYTSLKLTAQQAFVESVTSDRPIDAEVQPWYEAALIAQAPVWTELYSSTSPANRESVLISRSRPVFDRQNQIAGVVSTTVDIAQIDRLLQSQAISPSGVAYVLQPNGEVVSDSIAQDTLSDSDALELESTSQISLIQSSTAYLNQKFNHEPASIQQAQQLQFAIGRERQFLQVEPVGNESGLRWLVVVVIPEADFVEGLAANNRDLFYLCIGALGGAVALGVLIAQWLVQPINRLGQSATQLLQGEFERPIINRHSIKEVDLLGRSLDLMKRDLQQTFEALQASEQRFRRAIADAPCPMMIHAEDGEVLEINDAWTEATGYTHSDLPTMRAWTEKAYGERGPQILKDLISKLYELESRFDEGEFIVKTKSGSRRIWKFSSAPITFIEDRRVIISMAVDITERYQSEKALRESEARFRQLADSIYEIFYLTDIDYTETLYISPAYEKIWDKSCQSLYRDPRSFLESVHADDRSKVEASLVARKQGQSTKVVYRIIRPDGTIRWVFDRAFPVSNTAGQPYRISGVITDITNRKQAEAALKESQDRLQLVTENINDLVCLHEPDGRYLYVTPSSLALLGYSPKELVGKDPYDLFHPDDRDRIRQESHQMSLSGKSAAVTYRMRQKPGSYIWLETLTQPIFNAEGEVIHIQTTSRDVNDRVEAEAQLRHDALHDRLTELPNRSLLMARLDLALKRAKRHPENRFAVLFLDLDHFKVINDSLGHLVGDELLVTVSEKLVQLTRQVDLVARLGGDEFVILIEEITDTAEVIWVAERILSVLKKPIALGTALEEQHSQREVFIDVSIGVVFGDPDHHQPEDLLRDADLAMYRAKHRGRGQYALFEPKMRLQVINRLHLEHDLRQALDNNELVLQYQPIRQLDTMRLKGFEALVRWQHPQKGLISPGEFIEVAEETGLIVPMGQWILNAACAQLADWQMQFPDSALTVSVNLSVQQLQEELLKVLEQVPALSSLRSNSLTLEITESMLIQNVVSTQNLLDRIRELGIHLSIDDFGTGYSCLSYLHQLPVNALKIDRAFVSPDEPDARNRAIAESIIALTNQLGLDAIAEGIETQQQLDWLKAQGCEFGQGLLFAPAYSVFEATELLLQEQLSLR